MQIAILIALLFLMIFGVGGLLLFWFIRKTDPHARDRTEDPGIRTVQEFLPFEDIREDMILLGGHRYRAVLVCTSTNYRLKTAYEKEQIELSFQRFLNSVAFPVTFFLQTRVIDNTERLKQLEQELRSTTADFPSISSYARQYLQDMENLNTHLGNNQQKKRYIIVTYDNAGELSSLNDMEKLDYAARELRQRCSLLSASLETAGVSSRMLNTAELVELVYSCYHRDDYSYAEEIAKGDCFARFVEGEEDRFQEMPRVSMLNLILGETESRLQAGNLTAEPAVREALDQIRDMRARLTDGTPAKSGARSA